MRDFKITRNQKRALSSCKDVEVRITTPQYTQEKFELYLMHKEKFSSLQDDVEDEQNFRLSFYVNTPFGIEFEYCIGRSMSRVIRRGAMAPGISTAPMTRSAVSSDSSKLNRFVIRVLSRLP